MPHASAIPSSAAPPAVVDVHAHIVPPFVGEPTGPHWRCNGASLRRAPGGVLEIASPSGSTRGWIPKRYRYDAESVEQRLAFMDRAGVDVQVLSLIPAMWSYDQPDHDTAITTPRVNDYLHDVAAAHPDRFRAFAHLPLDHPDLAVKELERGMASPHLVGAAVGTHAGGVHWDEPPLVAVLEAAQDLGAMLFFHPSAVRLRADLPRHHLLNLVGNPSETTITLADLLLSGVLAGLPRLKAVFAHGGGNAPLGVGRWDHGYRARVEGATEAELPSVLLRRLYFDNIVHSDAALRFLVDVVGVERVVLGSDYPADMGPADPVSLLLGSTALDEGEKAAILGGNIAGVLDLGAGRRAGS